MEYNYEDDLGIERFGVLTEEMAFYEKKMFQEYKNKGFCFYEDEIRLDKKRKENKRYRLANPLTEKQIEKKREYAIKYVKENKDKIKHYTDKNRGKINAKSREYYKNNRLKCIEITNRYQKKNKEKIKIRRREKRELNKKPLSN
tara:strand:+ start:152 stop:583 length:432 start_codon:yes stop_codon:yes gene_type:complete